MILLLLNPGVFVPNIRRFVTGLESMTKRLAVSICEDSYTLLSRYNVIVKHKKYITESDVFELLTAARTDIFHKDKNFKLVLYEKRVTVE